MDPSSVALSALFVIGLPVLFVLYYFEGMVVGKVFQPAAVFVGYIAVVTPSRSTVLAIAALCALSTTGGQWTLYRGFNEDRPALVGIRRRVPYLDQVPVFVRDRVGQRWLAIVDRGFEAYGGLAVCVGNVLPGVRSLISVPAGLSSYPAARFLAFSFLGNLAHLGLVVAVAWGLLSLLGLR